MLSVMKALWRRWKGLAHGIIRAQNWLIMVVAYGVGMGPVAFIMLVRGEDLIDRCLGDLEGETYWLSLPAEEQDIRRAQRPW